MVEVYADEETAQSNVEQAGQEDEADLVGESVAEFGRAVVTATDWTTDTIIQQLARGNIQLDPKFQRRDAWAKGPKKSRFLESIFLGLPIPQIVLAEQKNERGSFLVIDGKQRLLALRQFAAIPRDGFEPLVLNDLELRSDLNGQTLESLHRNPAFARDIRAFENEPIRTVIVRSWPSEEFLYRVFLRLNSNTVPLSPQELRQALHPGPFVEFADQFSVDSEMVRLALRVTEPDFRMRDVELVVRFFAFDQFLADYAGNLKKFLDDTCKRLNARWADQQHQLREVAGTLDAAIAATFAVFDEFSFRRWNGRRFESYFNRAVFDVMTYFFKHPKVARAAAKKKESVVEAFIALSTSDRDFAESLATTTKSTQATNTRLDRWGETLSKAVGVDLTGYAFRGFANHVT